MFIAKKYSTFNEFILFSEYSVLLTNLIASEVLEPMSFVRKFLFFQKRN